VAEPLGLSLRLGEGAGIRIEWAAERILALGEAPTVSPWTLAEPIKWKAIDAVRLLSAGFEDDSLLVLAAVRPAAATGHGDEQVGAVLRRGRDEETELQQALLSTAYGADGEPTRIGIELLPTDDDVPLRGAGDARGLPADDDQPNVRPAKRDTSTTNEGMRRSATVLEMRLDGVTGTGLFEILRAP
jgi:hypothetical protein